MRRRSRRGREAGAAKPKAAKPKRRKRGRPRKQERSRRRSQAGWNAQLTMNLPQMLADLPRACDVGTKRNAKGHTTGPGSGTSCTLDTADGGIPISCVMTSASTHDSLRWRLVRWEPCHNGRARSRTSWMTLWTRPCDSIEICRGQTILRGPQALIIDANPRRSVEMQEALKQEKKARIARLGLVFPEERRYVVRSGSERITGAGSRTEFERPPCQACAGTTRFSRGQARSCGRA